VLVAAAVAFLLVTAGCASDAAETTPTPPTPTEVAETTPSGGADERATERLTSPSNDAQQEPTYADVVVTHPRAADVGQTITLEFRVTARRTLSTYRIELQPPGAYGESDEPLVWEVADLEPGETVEWTATLRAERPTDDLLLVRASGRPADEEYDFERTMAIRILIGETDDAETGPGEKAEQVTTTEGSES
jgi:hypothetical protein